MAVATLASVAEVATKTKYLCIFKRMQAGAPGRSLPVAHLPAFRWRFSTLPDVSVVGTRSTRMNKM